MIQPGRSIWPTRTKTGDDSAATNPGLPVRAINAFAGMLLFQLLAVDMLTDFRMRVGRVAT